MLLHLATFISFAAYQISAQTLDRVITLTDQQKKEFVDEHNAWRNKAAKGELSIGNKKGTKMPEIRWDEELAKNSENWGRQCRFKHSTKLSFSGKVGYSYGENLYAGSMTPSNYAKAAVDPWSLEHKKYNHSNRSCSGVCGHYTQVVWQESYRVGCSVVKCSRLDIGWGGYYILCQYWPPGNYPRFPYTYGSVTASSCVIKSNSWDGLCQGTADQKNICRSGRCSGQCYPGSYCINGDVADYKCNSRPANSGQCITGQTSGGNNSGNNNSGNNNSGNNNSGNNNSGNNNVTNNGGRCENTADKQNDIEYSQYAYQKFFKITVNGKYYKCLYFFDSQASDATKFCKENNECVGLYRMEYVSNGNWLTFPLKSWPSNRSELKFHSGWTFRPFSSNCGGGNNNNNNGNNNNSNNGNNNSGNNNENNNETQVNKTSCEVVIFDTGLKDLNTIKIYESGKVKVFYANDRTAAMNYCNATAKCMGLTLVEYQSNQWVYYAVASVHLDYHEKKAGNQVVFKDCEYSKLLNEQQNADTGLDSSGNVKPNKSCNDVIDIKDMVTSDHNNRKCFENGTCKTWFGVDWYDEKDKALAWCKKSSDCAGIIRQETKPGNWLWWAQTSIAPEFRIKKTGGMISYYGCKNAVNNNVNKEDVKFGYNSPVNKMKPSEVPKNTVDSSNQSNTGKCTTADTRDVGIKNHNNNKCYKEGVCLTFQDHQKTQAIEWCKNTAGCRGIVRMENDIKNNWLWFPQKDVSFDKRIINPGSILTVLTCDPGVQPTELPTLAPTVDYKNNYSVRLTNKAQMIKVASFSNDKNNRGFDKCFGIKPAKIDGKSSYYSKKSQVVLKDCDKNDKYQKWTYASDRQQIFQVGTGGKKYCWTAKFGKLFMLNCRYKPHKSGSKTFDFKNGQIQVIRDGEKHSKVLSYAPETDLLSYKANAVTSFGSMKIDL